MTSSGDMVFGVEPPRTVDTARAFIARGLDDAHRHRAIAPAAAAVFAHRLSEAPRLECAFACTWDSATETVTAARWLCRGNESEVRMIASDLSHPDLFVHNHPGVHFDGLTPSETDLTTAAKLAASGIGSAIISSDLSEFLLLHPPRASAIVTEQRSWIIGPARWGLSLTRYAIRRSFP